MGTIRRQVLLNALKIYDLGLMLLSFAVATIVVSHVNSNFTLEEFLSMRVKISNFVIFAGLLLTWHLVFSVFGIYDSHRLSGRWEETTDILKASSVGTLAILLGAALFHIRMITVVFALVFWTSSTLSTMLSRLILRKVLKQVRLHGRNLRDMLIVGTSARAVQFARKIEGTAELGYRIIGFVDDEWEGATEFRESGYKRVSDFAGLPSFLRQNVVDEVAMALPMRSLHAHASEVAALCEQQGIVLRFPSNLFNLKLAKSRADEFEGHSVITHYTGGMVEGTSIMVKRVFDFTVSLILIVLLSPVFLLAALLIKLTSRGPVFFVQNRLGLNKRRFKIYKLRTMVPDAEKKMKEVEHLNEVSGPVFKIKNDPRITGVGKFLRKTSIDELPQLLNVLTGDMSLVGPRPLPVRDYEGFSEDWQRRRFSVRPGITCIWQVGGRSSISFEKWMELDLQYIDKWSLWLDFQILLRTIPAVLKGSGAA
ncbi:MAG: sugar transferase [Acidobacteriia bacterium]|nr:sugar transferase [Terriglobia bacterium]